MKDNNKVRPNTKGERERKRETNLEKFFQLKKNGTDVKTEIIAGITTFMTMVYILAVNPGILSVSGMDAGAVFTATALASFVGCVTMGLVANLPFALAPGMGLNAYFSYTVCLGMGYDWRIAQLAVLIEGIIFIILSLTSVREKIFEAIPQTLKDATSAGIGLFVAFIGLQNANIIVADSSTGVTRYNFRENWSEVGITVAIALLGVLITAFLLIKKQKAAIFFGIILTWLLAVVAELTGLYVPNPELGTYSVIPSAIVGTVPSLKSTFGAFTSLDYTAISLKEILNLALVVFAFMYVDIFDTLGTLMGVSSQAKMLNEEGKLEKAKEAFLSDAIATVVGALFGTSTTTTYVESAAGISVGGRTGLTAIITGLLFLGALPFYPIVSVIPGFATAPALICVGFMMVASIAKINFQDYKDSIPAYFIILTMPLAYSISDGLAYGIISYTVLNSLCNIGKSDDKKTPISPLMYVLAILFIVKYVFMG